VREFHPEVALLWKIPPKKPVLELLLSQSSIRESINSSSILVFMAGAVLPFGVQLELNKSTLPF
jgi:hypothetical protein